PPGAGKSLLAKTLVSILPPLTEQEAIEVTKIHSICGLTQKGLITARPFRAPHHTTSPVGLIGGGSFIKPGEVSLAHHGVLFLDEFTEFDRLSLESLRQPMEDRQITISRAMGSVTFPARFCLLAAANPCRCGYWGSEQQQCCCSATQVSSYQRRLSGPILDRIDLQLYVQAVKTEKLAKAKLSAESSVRISERVIQARAQQTQRFKNTPYFTNADLSSSAVKEFFPLMNTGQKFLQQAANNLKLSARSYFKLIKVAQTIADLAGEDQVVVAHLAEALSYREGRRE
ncbi:MAG: magnesium chelatase, partial [Candidatus Pacebacteria bacterium]|nr:magnesium chelatase [Candidatus Paceibacterota bacterium]